MTSDLDLIREAIRVHGLAAEVWGDPIKPGKGKQVSVLLTAIPAFRRVLLKHVRCETPITKKYRWRGSEQDADDQSCDACEACKLLDLLKEAE